MIRTNIAYKSWYKKKIGDWQFTNTEPHKHWRKMVWCITTCQYVEVVKLKIILVNFMFLFPHKTTYTIANRQPNQLTQFTHSFIHLFMFLQYYDDPTLYIRDIHVCCWIVDLCDELAWKLVVFVSLVVFFFLPEMGYTVFMTTQEKK